MSWIGLVRPVSVYCDLVKELSQCGSLSDCLRRPDSSVRFSCHINIPDRSAMCVSCLCNVSEATGAHALESVPLLFLLLLLLLLLLPSSSSPSSSSLSLLLLLSLMIVHVMIIVIVIMVMMMMMIMIKQFC